MPARYNRKPIHLKASEQEYQEIEYCMNALCALLNKSVHFDTSRDDLTMSQHINTQERLEKRLEELLADAELREFKKHVESIDT